MKASPAAVHISLALGVVLYTLLGALIMQRLESSEKSGAVGRTTASEEGSQVPSPVKVYECLEHVVKGIMAKTKCMKREPDELSISDIDKCYESATIESDVFDKKRSEHLGVQPENGHLVSDEVGEEGDKWSFGNSLIFTFSIVTTIGYGHIAPETFSGRIFCIIFGLIGVPLTLIEIANLGMFISVVLGRVAGAISSIVLFFANCSWNKVKLKLSRRKERALITVTDSEEDNNSKEIDISETRRTGDAVILGLTFVCYLVLGALVLPGYEPEMDFFTALYFNFVTLTTMGLGDVVPKRFDYLFLTLCYIGIGLALTTMAINLAADILRKLHYFGRKMGNMAAAVVWFGGKKMTVGKADKAFR
ncbi:Ion channel [Parelaphostrongylus tenuis]|uniref:Ion channel n=1 Tax=Parelaphostrongylus tenuis TaxID=148309 RepID=A0AAD5QWT9_PARTN|nr:Ion channel [Parelaphostrongylus tenuis]